MPQADPPRPPRRTLGPGPGAVPVPAAPGREEPVRPGPDGGTGPAPGRVPDHVPDRVPGQGPDPVRERPAPAPEPEPDAWPEVGARPESASGAEARPEPDTETEPDGRPDAEPEPESEPEPEHGPDAGAEPAANARSEYDPEPEPGARSKADAGPGSEPGSEHEAEPEAAADARPEAGAESAAGAEAGDERRFTVRLANFEGPFDLLLQLISRHKLDVTEVALSKVTDEFMTYIRALGDDWDLDQATEFLVVAATLLDLKAARLLPAAEVEDEADLALLEARDLLFARLLQYRAYKQIAAILADRLDAESRRFPRTVGLEPHHADLLPEVVISIGAEGFARLAAKAARPKPKPQVYVDHIHAPLVSVREQARIVVALLRERGHATFRELAEGTEDTLTVVARFLALLELYRDRAVTLEQPEALGELTVTWTGGDGAGAVTDEFDRPPDLPGEKERDPA